jgi:hypothetical protein
MAAIVILAEHMGKWRGMRDSDENFVYSIAL